MDPKIWGRPVWTAIHLIALGYPPNPTPDTKRQYRVFFESLGPVLPCAVCSEHYAEHLAQLPMDGPLDAGGRALFNWTVAMRNLVNDQMGKPQLTPQDVLAQLAVKDHLGGGILSPGRAYTLGLGVILGALAVLVALSVGRMMRRCKL